MKKLILSLAIGFATAFSVNAQSPYSTNLTTAGVGAHLLIDGRASVYSVELTASYPCWVKFYDNNDMAAGVYGTNYVNAAYTGKSSYTTNFVTTLVGTTGYTNYYTNTGVYTLSTSVAAATNQLNPSLSFVVAGGTYAVYNTDALFTRGIVALANTNVSIVINYRNAQ